MKVIKLYRKPDKPEFYKLVRCDNHAMLVDYPISVCNRKRQSRWFYFDEVYVDWVRTFIGEVEDIGEEHGI
jgi:hypothetical protein